MKTPALFFLRGVGTIAAGAALFRTIRRLATTEPDATGQSHVLELADTTFFWNDENRVTFAAAPGLARTRCKRWVPGDNDGDGVIGANELIAIDLPSTCCGADDRADTLFIGDKEYMFHGLIDCDELSLEEKMKFPPVRLNNQKTRSTPVVDPAIGTIYVGNDSADDSDSDFYTLDMETGGSNGATILESINSSACRRRRAVIATCHSFPT